jgi:hypothetical protein
LFGYLKPQKHFLEVAKHFQEVYSKFIREVSMKHVLKKSSHHHLIVKEEKNKNKRPHSFLYAYNLEGLLSPAFNYSGDSCFGCILYRFFLSSYSDGKLWWIFKIQSHFSVHTRAEELYG